MSWPATVGHSIGVDLDSMAERSELSFQLVYSQTGHSAVKFEFATNLFSAFCFHHRLHGLKDKLIYSYSQNVKFRLDFLPAFDRGCACL